MAEANLVTEEEVLERARQDAVQNIPPPDQGELGEYEKYLIGIGESDAHRVVEQYLPRLEKLDGEIQALETIRKEGHGDDTRTNDEITQIQKDFIAKNRRVEHAERDLEITRKTFENWQQKAERLPVFTPWFYYVFAVLLGIGEVPLNAMIFTIFGENQIMTWVMATLIGFVIPLGAHFVGMKVREHGAGFSWPNALKAVIVAGFIVGALYAVTVMRQAYLGSISEEMGLTETVVQSSSMFFWLNVVIFVVAVTISYSTHEAIPGYAKVYKDYKLAQRDLEAAENKKNKALAGAGVQRAEKGRVTEKDEAELQAKLMKLCGDYDSVLAEGKQKEKCCFADTISYLNLYRTENIQRRLDGKKPKCFNNNEVEFHLQLTEIPEKLPNEA